MRDQQRGQFDEHALTSASRHHDGHRLLQPPGQLVGVLAEQCAGSGMSTTRTHAIARSCDATPSLGGFQSSGRVPRRPRDARVRLVPTEALKGRIRLCCADSHCALVSRTAPTRTCSASVAGRARPIAPIRIEAAERPRVARLRRSRSTRRRVESIEQIVSAMRSPRRSRAACISACNAMASTAGHASVDEIGDHGQRGLGADTQSPGDALAAR